jgi:hypothetical protein
MQAVAEEAQRRFRAEIEAALAGAPAGDPLGRFRCLGLAYLRWAMRNPTHFEIISSRRLFDHDRAVAVSSDNAELIELTGQTLAEAFALGGGRPRGRADRRGDPRSFHRGDRQAGVTRSGTTLAPYLPCGANSLRVHDGYTTFL